MKDSNSTRQAKVLKRKPTSLANSEEYVSTKGTNFFHLHSFCFQSVRGCNDFLPQAYMVIVIVTWWGEAPLLYSLCSTNRQTKCFANWKTKRCTINIHKSNLPRSITLQADAWILSKSYPIYFPRRWLLLHRDPTMRLDGLNQTILLGGLRASCWLHDVIKIERIGQLRMFLGTVCFSGHVPWMIRDRLTCRFLRIESSNDM